MVEIPEQDTWKDAFFLQIGGFHLVSFRVHAIINRRAADVVRVGSVPGNTAVLADLLQGNPLAVVGKDHVKAGGTALQCLQLHDHGNLCDLFPGHRLLRGNPLFPYSHLRQSPVPCAFFLSLCLPDPEPGHITA